MTDRIDYDVVASRYDSQPYRSKTVDPFLESAMEEGVVVDVLDVACGTGNQLIANHVAFPMLQCVGADASQGMLTVAAEKAPELTWVHAPAESLPFEDSTFDFITCQFAYHHFPDLLGAFQEVARVLKKNGRFVLSNITPHDYSDTAFYRMFPEAWEIDSNDFRPNEEILNTLTTAGFGSVDIHTRRTPETGTWGEFLSYVAERSNNSHLTALSDEAYDAGVERTRAECERVGASHPVDNELVIVTFVARLN